MNSRKFLTRMLFSAILMTGVAGLSGCGGGYASSAGPYESCVGGDYCTTAGLYCARTTLPVSSGYSGSFCTSTCATSSDCAQLVSNYYAICVNSQCYLQCPSGSNSCPYGQGCFTFSSNIGPVSLCTP